MKLTRRVFNSPLIKYAIFMDGNCVNIVQLNKPYANGHAYAVYVIKEDVGTMTVTLENALSCFNDKIRRLILTTDIDRVETTNNY